MKRYEISATAGLAKQLMNRVRKYNKRGLSFRLFHYFDIGRSYDCLILECEDENRLRVGTYDRKEMLYLAKNVQEIGYENITTDALEVLANAINNQGSI